MVQIRVRAVGFCWWRSALSIYSSYCCCCIFQARYVSISWQTCLHSYSFTCICYFFSKLLHIVISSQRYYFFCDTLLLVIFPKQSTTPISITPQSNQQYLSALSAKCSCGNDHLASLKFYDDVTRLTNQYIMYAIT